MSEAAGSKRDDTLTISSLEIAELTGKRHRDVMRDIRKMLTELEEDISSTLRTSSDSYGRPREHFVLDRYHTEVLITGYDIKRQAAVIHRLPE